MRSIIIDYNYNGKPTITKNEYLELKESLKNTFNPDKTSVLNTYSTPYYASITRWALFCRKELWS